MTDTKTDDPIIAFETGPPYHEWGVLCIDCGAPGFDPPLKLSEVTQKRCDWCGGDLKGTYKRVARRPLPLTKDEYLFEKYETDPFTKEPSWRDEEEVRQILVGKAITEWAERED